MRLTFLLLSNLSFIISDVPMAHLPFHHLGHLHTVNRMVLLQPEFHLSEIWQKCDVINTTVTKILLDYPLVTPWVRDASESLHKQCVSSKTWFSVKETRPKRQLFALAAVVGGVFGGLGLSSLFHKDDSHIIQAHQHEIEALADQMTRSANLTARIAEALLNSTKSDHEIHGALLIASDIAAISARMKEVSRGVVALFHGHLSPDLLSPDSLVPLWSSIKNLATKFHLHLPFDELLNLYELPVSFSMSEGTVTVVIPVPLSSVSFFLYEYIPFPLLIHEGENFLSLLPALAETHIAVDHAGATHYSLSPNTLAQCIKMGSHHFCSHLISLSQPTCISQLFFGNLANISSFCSLHHFPSKVALEPLDNQNLLISLHSASTPYTLDCQNGTFQSRQLHPGHQVVPMARECSIASKLFTIPAFSISRLRTVIRSSPLHFHSSFLPVRTSHLHNIVKEAQSLGLQGQHISQYVKTHPFTPSHFDIFSSSLFLCFAILLICFLIFLFFKARRNPPAA